MKTIGTKLFQTKSSYSNMVSCRNIALALLLVVTTCSRGECGVYSLIRDLIQWNVVGIPTFHEKKEWEFDPDVSLKRRESFYDLHGFRANKYLERIGQGIDGRHREREYEQAIRDEGRLQGLEILRP